MGGMCQERPELQRPHGRDGKYHDIFENIKNIENIENIGYFRYISDIFDIYRYSHYRRFILYLMQGWHDLIDRFNR
jgi:hypothetical protein